MKYEDILNKIIEIIKLSEQKKKELESNGIFDDKNFMLVYPYYIYKDYYKEFEMLKNKELTYFLLRTDKYAGLKNQTLIKECNKKINDDFKNKSIYYEIINIINSCNGKSASELVYANGYFVCQKDLLRFKELCSKYKIGYGKKIIYNKEEVLESIKNSKKQISDQKIRIQEYINKFNVNNITHNVSNNEFNITLNCKYKEIVYLGMLGHLNSKMVVELKNVMTDKEFDELLKVLEDYMIFSHDELLNIGLDVNEKVKHIKDIDELVAYLSLKKDIDLDALKLLIPSIGLDNYHYLVDQLFNFNSIDFDSYCNYLKECGYIDNNEAKVK